jgi:hypothetical protein
MVLHAIRSIAMQIAGAMHDLAEGAGHHADHAARESPEKKESAMWGTWRFHLESSVAVGGTAAAHSLTGCAGCSLLVNNAGKPEKFRDR